MEPLAELTAAVGCRWCGHSYPDHGAGAGHCRARQVGWGSIERDIPCPCDHFRWLAPGTSPDEGPPRYGGAPSPAYGG